MRDMCRKGIWLSAAILVLGCDREDDPRPAPALDCNEDGCTAVRGPVVIPGGNAGGEAGASGAGGEGGGGNMPPPGLGTLAGTVRMIVEPDLSGSRSLDQVLEIRAAAASGEEEVVAESASGGSFRLEGVRTDPVLWVGVGAFDEGTTGAFMDTLQPVDASRAESIQLLVVRRSLMDELAQTFLTNPELDPLRGHALISFVDPTDVPIAGLRITFPNPEEAAVGYDAGAIYSDQAEQTSTRGSVLLLNLPAAPYPGGATGIVAEVGTRVVDFNLRIASGSVTLVTIQIEP